MSLNIVLIERCMLKISFMVIKIICYPKGFIRGKKNKKEMEPLNLDYGNVLYDNGLTNKEFWVDVLKIVLFAVLGVVVKILADKLIYSVENKMGTGLNDMIFNPRRTNPNSPTPNGSQTQTQPQPQNYNSYAQSLYGGEKSSPWNQNPFR